MLLENLFANALFSWSTVDSDVNVGSILDFFDCVGSS